MLQRKKEKDLAIKRQVELSNKMLADKQSRIDEHLNDKKQRIDVMKNENNILSKQSQLRQKQILMEKRKLQESIAKLRGK
jgi:hypothetical protein